MKKLLLLVLLIFFISLSVSAESFLIPKDVSLGYQLPIGISHIREIYNYGNGINISISLQPSAEQLSKFGVFANFGYVSYSNLISRLNKIQSLNWTTGVSFSVLDNNVIKISPSLGYGGHYYFVEGTIDTKVDVIQKKYYSQNIDLFVSTKISPFLQKDIAAIKSTGFFMNTGYRIGFDSPPIQSVLLELGLVYSFKSK